MIEMVRWLGTGTGIVAAVLVAANAGPKVSGVGFIIFTICSVCWTVVGLSEDKVDLALLNGVLTVINLIGVYRYLIAKPPRIGAYQGFERAG